MALSGTPVQENASFQTALYPPASGSGIASADIITAEVNLASRTLYLKHTQPIAVDVAGILALLQEELDDYAAHRASATFHNPADTANVVATTPPLAGVYSTVPSVSAQTRANLLKAGLRAHYLNTGGSYHDAADTVNEALLAAVPDATDTPSLRFLVIRMKAIYNAHRTQAGVHPVNDGTNIVLAADPAAPALTGSLAVSENLSVGGSATIEGAAVVNDNITAVGGNISATTVLGVGGNVTAAAALAAGTTLDVGTDATIGNDLTIGGSVVGDLDVTGTVTVGINLDVTGDAAVAGSFTASIGFTAGNGLEHREQTFAAGAPISTPNQYDTIFLQDPAAPATVTVISDATVANPRPRVRFTSQVTFTNDVTVRDQSAIDLFTFPVGFSWADIEWDGGAWRVVAWGGAAVRLV